MTKYVVIRDNYIFGPMSLKDAQSFMKHWGGKAKPLADATYLV